MKILFWLLALASLPVGLFMSFTSYMAYGLDLAGTGIGVVVCFAGMFSLIVSILCMVLGILKLRKGDVKKALICALIGMVYSFVILGGMFVDDAVHGIRLEKSFAEHDKQMYGEGWDSPPAIEGIPKHYETLLNKFYATVRDEMTDNLMGLGAVSMEAYYSGASLDDIGFVLMDVNADGVDELVIGTVAPVEEGGTAVFCLYSDPENPHYTLSSVEGETYYLHYGEAEGSYLAEIEGRDAAWLLETVEGESFVGIDSREGAMDPADRLTLEMIPFSQYK